MTTTNVDGTSYDIPDNGARGWGTETTNLLKALGDNSLLIKGGSIPLTSEADFGGSFGLKSLYFESQATNPSPDGAVRLGNAEQVKWRNAANDNQVGLGLVSDFIAFEGVVLLDASSSQTMSSKTINASNNTLSEIDTTMWASGVLNTSTTLVGASDLNVPSTLAIKTYVDNALGGQNDATEITYTPTTPGDWTDPDPDDVGEGLDDLATRVVATESHVTNTSNPHSVTASQVGLGNVDNTSDVNKPVSTAQQTALDAKVDETITLTAGSGLTGGGDLTLNRTFDVNVDNSTIEINTDIVRVKDIGITAAKLASNSVETAKILDSNVTSAKLEDNIIIPGNARLRVPVGTTGERPGSPAQGDIRFNTTSTTLEAYDGTAWDDIPGAGGGASLAGTDGATSGTVKTYIPEIQNSVVTKSADFSPANDDGVEFFPVTTGTDTIDINLPPPASTNKGKKISVMKVDSGTGFIRFDVGDTISGITGSNLEIQQQYEGLTLLSTGTEWVIDVAISYFQGVKKALDNGFSTGNVTILRQGYEVSVFIGYATHSSTTNVTTSSGFLPTWARPIELIRQAGSTFGASSNSRVSFQTNGTIEIAYFGGSRTDSGAGNSFNFTVESF